MLASGASVQYGCRQDIERPLIEIHWVHHGLIGMGQQCEHIDLGMSPGNFGEPSSVRIPRQRPGGAERDLGKSLLGPALQVRRRLTSTRTPPGVVRSQAAQPSRTPSVGMPRAVATMNSASTPRSVLSRRSDLLQPQKSATVAPASRPAAVNVSAPVFRDALIRARLSMPLPPIR